jgi:hypothetical protein
MPIPSPSHAKKQMNVQAVKFIAHHSKTAQIVHHDEEQKRDHKVRILPSLTVPSDKIKSPRLFDPKSKEPLPMKSKDPHKDKSALHHETPEASHRKSKHAHNHSNHHTSQDQSISPIKSP